MEPSSFHVPAKAGRQPGLVSAVNDAFAGGLGEGEAMRQAAFAVSTVAGEGVFRALVTSLARILGTDLAFIALPLPVSPAKLRMLAFYLDGRTIEDFVYALAGTPCETVIGQQYRVYPAEITRLFPMDDDFSRLGLSSYAGYPLSDAHGGPLGIISVASRRPLPDAAMVESMLKIFAARAVTEIERSRTDTALRASEEQYRAIFTASVDGMALVDTEGRIVDVNPAFTSIWGYPREDLVGLALDRLAPDDEGPSCMRLLSSPTDGLAYQGECQVRHRDGTLVDVEVRGVPMHYNGQPHVLAILRDIGERRRAETQRAQLETQLRQAQKMEAIGQLTGGIAHDFNNILTSVLGYTVLALERAESAADATLVRYLEQTRRASQRARDLIQQMLTFSRGRRGEARLVALGPQVRESLELLRSTLPATIELDNDLHGDVPQVLADPVQCEQVLLNLCINARDAIVGAGTIRVALRRSAHSGTVCASCRKAVHGDYVELAVTDTGAGIEQKVLDRMFEPFFTTKEIGKGSGMGLATVHGIAHEHRGHVVVESAPGKGSTFRVLFPVPVRIDGFAPAAPDPWSRPATVRRQLAGRVLVVDDESMVADYMRELLLGWGLEVTVKVHAPDAERWYAEDPQRVDLVITDQTMPRITGLQLARAMTLQRPEMPVFLHTGNGEDVAPDVLVSCGVAALLRKPVDPEELLALLQLHLPRRAP